MFLKSLEVRGFKSFADKTELEFKKGVTAVVGPNGSGKSNISDAVRWVLGEQSVKNLRGGKMQDVIFAGTQFRKPVGLAQVSLVLDNSDKELNIEYSQVKITRRIYKSGESEYFINNTKCRLKDVHELFMDTGIGKEGYSLIGQGKIDAILSSQSEDRRLLLEEAAGIVKFKTRKQEAEKRLDNAEQNLVRINDILSTYEERIEPLRIDKEKAEMFLECSQELRVKEINLIIDSIDKVKGKGIGVQEKIQSNSKELGERSKEKENLKIWQESLNKELDEFELSYSKDRQKYYSSVSEKEKIESNITLLKERSTILLNQILKYKEEEKEFEVKLKALNSDKNKAIDDKREALNRDIELKNKIDTLEKNIGDMKESLAKENHKLGTLKKEYSDILEINNKKNNESIILEKELKDLKDRFEDIDFELNSLKSSIKINDNTCIALEKESKKAAESIKDYEGLIGENNKKIQYKRSEHTRKEKELGKIQRELSEIEANYKVLVNLNEQYEGYTKAVKLLMQSINQGNIHNAKDKAFVLGEVISVDRKLETAIEIALGAAISNIITEDENLAKKLINHLKINKLGRATFLPLNIVKGKHAEDNNIKKEKGYIGVASQAIDYNGKFRNAVEYVLGRTLLVDNMDNALLIAKKISYSYKIVTLDGEVINPGGSLTGGSIYHKSTNLISRKREIQELTLKRDESLKLIGKCKEELNSCMKEIEDIDETILNLREQLHSMSVEQAKIQTKYISMKNERNELEGRLKEKVLQKQTQNDKLNNIKSKLEAIKIELEKEDAEKLELEALISSLGNKIFNDDIILNNLRDEITDLKISKAKSGEVLSSKDKELDRIILEIEENILKTKKIHSDLQKAIVDEESSKVQIVNQSKKNEEISELIINLENAFKDSEMKRVQIKDKIKETANKLETMSDSCNLFEKEVHKYQLIFAKVESELENLYEKLNEDLKLTYAEALEFKEDNLNVVEISKDITELKKKISSLGVVNVGAIEEYKELTKKYEFMDSQRNDLMSAKEELLKVIEEMTEKMRVVFKENLIKLRKNFDETFKELFKGGSADLILSDGDELTAKIDINVQPPGKKLQNISLMSGGEKVLSAIALLFAILKMKPTPFCILDEIEAALDEANVFRYAEFLRKFSEKIQFIVITHRKGTMQVSDILYGVTMEEKGVSKIISVDMNSSA